MLGHCAAAMMPIGEWDFDDPSDFGKATVGTDLTISNTSNTVVAVAGPNQSAAVRVGVGDYLELSRAGQSTMNSYSLVMDIMAPSVNTDTGGGIASAWRGLLHTGHGTSNAHLWLQPGVQLGHGNMPGSGYVTTDIPPADVWYRLVMYGHSNPGNDFDMRFTLIDSNGDLIATHRIAGTEGFDQQHALHDTVRFSWAVNTPSNNEEMHIAGIRLYDEVLTQLQAESLGAPGTGGALLMSSGPVGGPFSPSAAVRSIANNESASMDWVASIDYGDGPAGWITLSAQSGTLAPGESQALEVALNSEAESIPFGEYAVDLEIERTVGDALPPLIYRILLQVEPIFRIPYVEDFEGAPLGGSPILVGWQASDLGLAEIIARTSAYSKTYPLPASSHAQVLDVAGEDVSVQIEMQEGAWPEVYMDVLSTFRPSYKEPILDDGIKMSLYMDADHRLQLFHGGADGNGNMFAALDRVLEEDEWYRVTVRTDFAGVVPFFQVLIDGEVAAGIDSGFPEPSLDTTDHDVGNWFRFAHYHEQTAAGSARRIRAVDFSGSILLDDFVLSGEEPRFENFRIRSGVQFAPDAGMDSDSPWMNPVGEPCDEHPDARVSEVPGGHSIDITYSAAQHHHIAALESDGVPVSIDPGATAYVWTSGPVASDIENLVVFGADTWGVAEGGDGQTPKWWAAQEEIGFTDGSALTVREGFIVNKLDLDSRFELIGIGRTEDGRIYIEWHSDGPARGSVAVRTAATLAPPTNWTLQNGSIQHENGVSTWTSNAEPDGDYFRIQILDTDA